MQIQRSLVLLGSASQAISQERRKIAWSRINSKLKSLADENYGKREDNLFGPGFLEKASKKLEVDKTIRKVSQSGPPPKKARYSKDASDLRHFMDNGATARYGSSRFQRHQPYTNPQRSSNQIGTSSSRRQPSPRQGRRDQNQARARINPGPPSSLTPTMYFITPPTAFTLPTPLWTSSTCSCKLGLDHRRPLDPQGHPRLQLGASSHTNPEGPSQASSLHEPFDSVLEEVDKLVQKGAIKGVSPAPGQFVSRIFTVPQKGGSVCPVVNLWPLSKFVAKKKFKMENSAVLRDLIKPKDWMTSIDLKDAFLSVPMAAHHRKLLRFMCGGRLYELQCLPFGLYLHKGNEARHGSPTSPRYPVHDISG